jgi:biopolymer transport protein ExbB
MRTVFGVFLLALAFAVAPIGAQESEAVETENIDSALVSAYQREFVFLNNEIQILEERLNEVRADGNARVVRARSRLDALEADLLSVTAEVDRRTEELRIVEEESFDVRDADDALRNIVTQATSRLRENDAPTFEEAGIVPDDVELSEGDRLALELGYVFETSFAVLEDLGQVRVDDGQFFLEDGRRVEGQVVSIGQIASLGVASDGSGTLAPAGGGQLRLVDRTTGDVARDLADGPLGVSSFPIYLYESLDTLVETERGSSLQDTIEGGGIIGLVIIGIGIATLILVLIRIFLLATVGGTSEKAISQTINALESRDFDTARTIAGKLKGAAGRVLSATIEGLRVDPEHIEDVISENVLNAQPRIDRFRSTISVFAAVAPLLGLLGTVTGMIATFDVITQFGTGDPGLLSGGISEALITTQLGLTVAIPALLVGNLLSSWADRITSNLEISALRMVNTVTGHRGTGAA